MKMLFAFIVLLQLVACSASIGTHPPVASTTVATPAVHSTTYTAPASSSTTVTRTTY